MAQKIGKGDEIFLDAVYRQAVDVLSVQVPQEKFLHVWERKRCCSLRLLSTQGMFRITIAKDCQQRIKGAGVHRPAYDCLSWPLGTKRHFSARRSCENSGKLKRKDVGTLMERGMRPVSEMKLKFVMRATWTSFIRVGGVS